MFGNLARGLLWALVASRALRLAVGTVFPWYPHMEIVVRRTRKKQKKFARIGHCQLEYFQLSIVWGFQPGILSRWFSVALGASAAFMSLVARDNRRRR